MAGSFLLVIKYMPIIYYTYQYSVTLLLHIQSSKYLNCESNLINNSFLETPQKLQSDWNLSGIIKILSAHPLVLVGGPERLHTAAWRLEGDYCSLSVFLIPPTEGLHSRSWSVFFASDPSGNVHYLFVNSYKQMFIRLC